MSVQLHLLESTGNLNTFKDQVNSAFDSAVKKATSKIALRSIDVVIWDNPWGAIPETGIGGRTSNPNTIFIAINPGFSDLDKTISLNLEKTLLHEFHHCARWATVGYGRTLWKALISEGLADHFQVEITGGDPPPWSKALPEEELKRISVIAEPEYDNNKYNHNDWFFGNEDLKIPRWAGYSLGFKLVSDYLAKNKQDSAASLFSKEAQEFKI